MYSRDLHTRGLRTSPVRCLDDPPGSPQEGSTTACVKIREIDFLRSSKLAQCRSPRNEYKLSGGVQTVQAETGLRDRDGVKGVLFL